MAVTSLISISLRERQDVFLICSYQPAQNLCVTVLDIKECEAFSGQATDLDLRSQAATIQMTFSDFVSLTKKALTENERESEQFLYSLEENCTDFLFKWKSIDEEETVIDIGNVKLIKSDYGLMIKDSFLILSKELFTLSKKVLTLDKDLTSVKKEKDDTLLLLSDAMSVKERVEKELYSKFMLVLNEKKQKIRELKQNDTFLSNVKLDNTKKKRSKVVHHISESSDEATSDFEKMDVPGPSNSKQNNPFQFLDDDDDDRLKISPSKRRNRNKNASNKILDLHESKLSVKDVAMESESEDELLNKL